MEIENNRHREAQEDPMFPDRWSPRSFDPTFQIGHEELRTLVSAAHWAPSSFNEQPWFFHVALHGSQAFDDFIGVLNDTNQTWAKNSSALFFIVGSKKFEKNGKPNTTFEFDCGSAWMSLTMQAHMMGLFTHGMVGFDRDKAAELLKVDTGDHKVIAAFAVGKRSDPEKLPKELREKEKINSRKDLNRVYEVHGSFTSN